MTRLPVSPTKTFWIDGKKFDLKNAGPDDGIVGFDVSWTVYRSSDSILTPGVDPVVDAGSHARMLASDPTALIPFSGTWPSTAASYWLFVTIASADDVVPGNDTAFLGPIAVAAPKVDYAVSAVQSTGATIAGGGLKGDFRLDNLTGADDGTGSVLWTVYVSTDPILTVGVDPVVASGMHAGLPAGAFAAIGFTDGFWPADPGTYFLIATVTSVETDSNTGNNTASSAGVLTTGGPDYTISASMFPMSGAPGAAISGTRTFTVKNLTANTGNRSINWRVYASTDRALDGSDFIVAQGAVPALPGSGSYVVNDLNGFNGTWGPKAGGEFLIVQLDADDDANPANDLTVSGMIPVFNYTYAEVESNDDSTGYQGGFTGNTIPSVLAVDQAVLITGTLDLSGKYDAFEFQIGVGVGHLEIYATWSVAADCADLETYWNDAPTYTKYISPSYALGTEPEVPPFVAPVYAPGPMQAVSVLSWGPAGTPYQLMITARP